MAEVGCAEADRHHPKRTLERLEQAGIARTCDLFPAESRARNEAAGCLHRSGSKALVESSRLGLEPVRTSSDGGS
jgi:hypothetical protein